MCKINFYKDKNGREPVKEYLVSLARKKDKGSRIKANKIANYIDILRQYGTHVFMKQTQKTPLQEIEKAKSNLSDYRERNADNE